MIDKLSSDQSVPINRESEELSRYNIFSAIARATPKTYQLVLRGAFFGHRLKVLPDYLGTRETVCANPTRSQVESYHV